MQTKIYDDSNAQAVVVLVKDGSIFRELAPTDFGSINLTGGLNAEVNVERVGISGEDGQPVSVVSRLGMNCIPVVITSGEESALSKIGITGSDGSTVDVVSQAGKNCIPVVVENNVSEVTILGISGEDGKIVDVVSSIGYDCVPVVVTSGNEISISSTSTRVPISGSVESQTALSAKSRKAWTFYNQATTKAYIGFGTGVSEDDFSMVVEAGEYYESPINFTNDNISVVWEATPSGSGFFTELT